jgi:hypothetical protein
MRGLLRLGLVVGVRSLVLPACSKCSSAFDSADASIGSEVPSSWLRLWEAVGGVFDSGGEMSAGVATSFSVCWGAGADVGAVAAAAAAAAAAAFVFPRAMLVDALGCAEWWRKAAGHYRVVVLSRGSGSWGSGGGARRGRGRHKPEVKATAWAWCAMRGDSGRARRRRGRR